MLGANMILQLVQKERIRHTCRHILFCSLHFRYLISNLKFHLALISNTQVPLAACSQYVEIFNIAKLCLNRVSGRHLKHGRYRRKTRLVLDFYPRRSSNSPRWFRFVLDYSGLPRYRALPHRGGTHGCHSKITRRRSIQCGRRKFENEICLEKSFRLEDLGNQCA